MLTASVLPPGAYRLKSGFVVRRVIGGALFAIFGLVMIGAGTVWQGSEALALRHESEVWEHGVKAPASVDGTHKANHFIFNDYSLKVEYTDASEVWHTHRLSMTSIFSAIDKTNATYVMYAPDHPDDYVLSWAHDISGGRWGSIIMFMVIFTGMGALMIAGAVSCARQIRDARRAAEAGHAILVALTAITPRMVKGRVRFEEYHYRGVDDAGVAFTGKATFKIDGPKPLLVGNAGGEGGQCVALAAPGSAKRIVLRADFYPLDLDAEQARAARDFIARSAAR